MVIIVQKEDPILRKKALPVPQALFGTPKLKKILRDMSTALASQDDGVAIAAPQIEVSKRIFVITRNKNEKLYPEKIENKKKTKDIVFINPEIIKLSREREVVEEGCLSVRYLYGTIKRSKKTRIKAQDENGNNFELGGSGLLAQIFQHETDHLEGTLFIDKADNLRDMPPEEKPKK